MEKKMTFNYFYGTEADQFSFYRIPKALFTDSYFKDLSSDAKILYGLMLDRMSLSIKNQWFDDKNRAYIYFSIEDIMELLNCGRNKAIKSMRELDDETGIGLIEKRRQGFGKVNVIYVKTFMPEKTDEKKFEEELKKFKKQTSLENEEPTEVYNSNFMKSQNQTSRSPENKLQEVYISNPKVNANHLELARQSNHVRANEKVIQSQKEKIEQQEKEFKENFISNSDRILSQGELIEEQREELQQLTVRIEDVETLLDEVSSEAYDKAVEKVAKEAVLATRKDDIYLAEDSKRWIQSPERKASRKEKEYAIKRLDGLIRKIENAMEKAVVKIVRQLKQPEKKKAVVEEIKNEVKPSIREKLAQNVAKIQREEAERKQLNKGKSRSSNLEL